MELLGANDGPLPVLQLHPLRAHLSVLNATEVASFWTATPKPPEPVQWPGFKLYVAADIGLFAFEVTAGWDEPYVTASGTVGEAWKIQGSFRAWSEVVETAVILNTAWDDHRGAHRPVRSLHAERPPLDVHEPAHGWSAPGSDQGAWADFVRACIELTGRTR